MQKRFLAISLMVCLIFGTIGQNPFASAKGSATAHVLSEMAPGAEVPLGEENPPEEELGKAEPEGKQTEKQDSDNPDADEKVLGTTITTSDGSTYEIEVTYPDDCGVPSEGTELLVSEIKPDEAGYDDYVAASMEQLGAEDERVLFARVFDITIADAKDHSIVYEPNGAVRVSIRLADTDLDACAKVDVLHITEQKTRGTKGGTKAAPARSYSVDTMKTTKDGDTVEFTTESFSVYVIVGHEGEVKTPRVEFHYISPVNTESGGSYTAGAYLFANQNFTGATDDTNYFWTQIVKDGETLTHVPTPSDLNNSHFEGWYIVSCTSDTVTSSGRNGTYTYRWPKNPERQSFDKTVSVSISGSTVTYTIDGVSYSGEADSEGCLHVYLAPLYMNYRFVDFYDFDGNLVARKLLVLDQDGEATICVSDVTTINPDSRFYFMGWSTVKFQESPRTQTADNTFRIYQDGYIVDTYITLKENSDGTFNIYKGSSVSGTPFISSYSGLNSDVILYAEFEMAHWLRFVAGESGWGALYVPADYLVGDEPAASLPTTTRPGYVFDGWYTGWQDKTSGTIYYVTKVTDNNGAILSDVTADLINNDVPGSLSVTGTSANGVSASLDDARRTGDVSGGELTMTDHSYLFAKWEPKKDAKYTVVIWKQKVPGPKTTDYVYEDYTPAQYEAWKAAYKAEHNYASNEQVEQAWIASGHSVKVYDYYASFERYCVEGDNLIGGSTDSDRGLDFYGFHLADNVIVGGNTYYSYDIEASVDPQGTTVFNVYYDRNMYTFEFRDNYTEAPNNLTNYQGSYVGKNTDGSYFQVEKSNNRYYYYGTNTRYYGTVYYHNGEGTLLQSFEALYEQNIAGCFPVIDINGKIYNNGERWDEIATANDSKLYNQVIVLVNQMPGQNVKFALDVAERTTKTFNYYVEALDTDLNDNTAVLKEFENVVYRLHRTVSANVGFSTREDYLDFYGFEHNISDPDYTYDNNVGDDVIRSEIVDFYYYRIDYQLTFDMNYPGEATFSENPATTERTIFLVPFETVLTQYSSTPSPNAPDHFVFDGWYEDKSGTTPFDFDDPNGIQGDKIVYAKWYPVYYLIQIDPAGGTLAGSNATNQSTYFWLQYGTAIGRYDTVREYIEVDASDASVSADIQAHPERYYYYRYVDFNQFEHSRWGSVYNVADLYYVDPSDSDAIDAEKDNEGIKPSFDRLAEYISLADFKGTNDTFYQYLLANIQPDLNHQTESTAEYWNSQYVDETHIYRKIDTTAGDPSYTLVGWYHNGQPYDFPTAVTEPITLTAVWRQSGSYHLSYSAMMTELVNGTRVFGSLTNAAIDPIESETGYADGADAVIGTAPNNIQSGNGDDNVYVFEGWRLVNSNGDPIDESGNVITTGTGTLYQPGDHFTVLSTMTTTSIIYLEAYYRNVTDSSRRPHTVNLILDANTRFAGEVDPSSNSNWTWVKPGTIQADTSADQILFGDTQTNVSVSLSDFADSFVNTNHYFLLGFDEGSDIEKAYNAGSAPDGLRSGAAFVASYPIDTIIGIDLSDPYPNLLYAVWEPMVYATFVNDTEVDIEINISSNSTKALSIVNEANGIYVREPITGNTITIPAGKQVKIVLPYGEGKEITAEAINNHSGYRMNVSSEFAGNANEAATSVPGSQNVLYGETAAITDRLHYDSVGITVTYTEELIPFVYYNVNGGTWTETNTGTNVDTQFMHDANDTSIYYLSATAIEALNGNYKPSNPYRSNLIFVGWTLYPAIAAQTDFSGTNEVTWGTGNDAVTITPDADSNLLAKVKSDYLWDFTQEPPHGQTLYAVWSETVTVTFDISCNTSNTYPYTTYYHTWTDNSGLYNVDDVNHIYNTVIAKGDKVPQPTNPTPYAPNAYSTLRNASFLYWVFNHNNPSNNYTNYRDVVTTDPSSINSDNIFDFSKPVLRDTKLFTSWTKNKNITVTIKKQLEDVLGTEDKNFDFAYTIKTYRYSSNNTNSPSLESEISSGFSLGNDDSESIQLYYWASGNNPYYFYYQTLEISEGDYSIEYDLSYDLSDEVSEENGIVMVDIFSEKMSYTTNGGRRFFRYNGQNYYYRVSDNTWYNGTNNNSNTVTFPITSASATFINTRKTKDVKVVKIVDDDDTTGTFQFTAMVMYKGSVITAYDENDFTDGVRTFSLQHGESNGITLKIPYGATFVVEETVSEDYSVRAESNDYTDTDAEDNRFTVDEVNKETATITFTNTKKLIAPTAVGFDAKPYLWMIILAGFLLAGLLIFGRKKKED